MLMFMFIFMRKIMKNKDKNSLENRKQIIEKKAIFSNILNLLWKSFI